MDTSLMSVKEFFSTDYMGIQSYETSSSEDTSRDEWEVETEINGDKCLIPESSSFSKLVNNMDDITELLTSSDCPKLTTDWHALVGIYPSNELMPGILPESDEVQKSQSLPATNDGNHTLDEVDLKPFDLSPSEELCDVTYNTENIFDVGDVNGFDLTEYVNELPIIENKEKKCVKSRGKKIDMEACKYIIDDEDKVSTGDEIDIETVPTSLPVLEANDEYSLLEQFEASEQPISHNSKPGELFSNAIEFNERIVRLEMETNLISTPPSPIDIFERERIPNAPVDIFEEDVKVELPIKIEQIDASEYTVGTVTDTKKNEPWLVVEQKGEIKIKQEVQSPRPEETSIEETQFPVEQVQVKQEIKSHKIDTLKRKPATKNVKPVDIKNGLSKQNGLLKPKEEVTIKQEVKSEKLNDIKIKQEPNSRKPQTSKTSTTQIGVRNNVKETLPQDLIKRIKESGKRKTITVIPPIPNTKKRGASRPIESISQHRNKIPKISPSKLVQLDHDYCTVVTPYPKEPKKDSGFQSAEEEDRSVLRNQPTVKTPDGKVMVSLLKANTIRNNTSEKKRLNLDEYRKMRNLNSNPTSQNTSPINSTCNSPRPEDEYVKNYAERIKKLADGVLKTCPKSVQQVNTNASIVNVNVKVPPAKVAISAPKPPPHVEMKVYASVGINTQISSMNFIKSMVESAQTLEELKPLLEKVSNQINSNSLLSSAIENIPKASSYVNIGDLKVIREDMTHHFFDKNMKKPKMCDAMTQTSEVDEDQRPVEGGGRSPGACSSDGSHSSDHSSSSRRSYGCRNYKSPPKTPPFLGFSHSRSRSRSRSHSRSRSRSRSRSISPRRFRRTDLETKNDQERRIVFVGDIKQGTTIEDLRRRFSRFGPIINIRLQFRAHGDNYGFVKFVHQQHAFDAIDHGNDGDVYPQYDISFGGRREFCDSEYEDLDNMCEEEYYYAPRIPEVVDYTALLMQHAQARRS